MIIAVIAPTFNEEENISELVDQLQAIQPNLPPDSELHIVISDSHSEDNTQVIANQLVAQNPNVHFIDVHERGIGRGIILGFQYARDTLKADILIQIDADLSHPPQAIPLMVQKLNEGYNLVIGSRFVKGGKNDLAFHRRFFSYGANLVSRLILGVYNVKEFTTSYRAMTTTLFNQVDLNQIPWESKSFVFQPSFVYQLIQKGAKYTEIPIIFSDRKRGRSKLTTVKYIKELMLFVIKERIKKSKQFVKFLVVGATGFTINTLVLLILVEVFRFSNKPLASAIGAEVAIISNFVFNNFWTFKHTRVHRNNAIPKFLQFNLSSFGAVLIQYVVVWLGEHLINPYLPFSQVIIDNLYLVYYVISVGIGLFYNYFMYSRFIWKKKPAPSYEYNS